ncbi:MAG: hypothetical protein V7750_03485 [Sneathiella sp.]
MKYFALVFLVILAACNTTGGKPADISNVNLKNLYALGTFVTYSELCATFSGAGADKLKIRALKEKYEGDRQFKKGMDRDSNLFVYDWVQLNDCPRANAVIDAAYNNNSKTATVLPNPAPSNVRGELYQLEVSWENLLTAKKTYPVYVKNTGRKGYLTSVSLIGGKDCRGAFDYTSKGAGSWIVACKDGTKATGVMKDIRSGKGSTGSGTDTAGNIINFKLYQLAFAK